MVIHRDLKPANIGFRFKNIDSEVFLDEEKAANFLKNFNFLKRKGEGTYQLKFFDMGMSETVDENGFGST